MTLWTMTLWAMTQRGLGLWAPVLHLMRAQSPEVAGMMRPAAPRSVVALAIEPAIAAQSPRQGSR